MSKSKLLSQFVIICVAFGTLALTKDLFITALFSVIALLLMTWLFMWYQFKKRKMLRNSNLDEIDTMEGLQFEKYLYELFAALGYKVKRTADSGDFGADLILNDGDSIIVVQAKRYKSNVGIQSVQEVLGAKAYYDADYAWVVTNSSFTNAAIELAHRSGVSLNSRLELSKLMVSAGVAKPSEKEIKRSFENPNELNKMKCPLCFSPMVLRKGKHGVFYGCSTFPKCKGIKESK